ncbi:MAG: 6-carboxytetrahydropterin synthase QueD [Candidatus Binatia bacterium]|nr:6-carboxytetrahydropterin synthase QueD [Candidatus Binatia bacterium]
MFEVSKEFRFEAAHSLPHLDYDSPCKRLHGHSYRFEVVCRGDLDERGFVIDYAEISDTVNPIIERLDHHNLNDLFDFHTSAENLARWLFEEIDLPQLFQIRLYETPKTCVVYPV